MNPEYIVEQADKKYLTDIAALWRKMISYYYLVERNFNITEDCEKRYLKYLESIYIDSLTRILIARDNDVILGFMIGEISLRPPVIVKGYIGIIEDYWVNRLYLSRDSQMKIKKKIFFNIKKWFDTKKVERIRLEISTQLDEDKELWESLGFISNKWVMFK